MAWDIKNVLIFAMCSKFNIITVIPYIYTNNAEREKNLVHLFNIIHNRIYIYMFVRKNKRPSVSESIVIKLHFYIIQ